LPVWYDREGRRVRDYLLLKVEEEDRDKTFTFAHDEDAAGCQVPEQ